MSDYSLADLTRITGAKRRSVQLWAEAGVIRADQATERAGTGTHRRFSRGEAIVACLISPFALRQISIGELLNVSAGIRALLKKDDGGKAVIDGVINGTVKEAYLIMMTVVGTDKWSASVKEWKTAKDWEKIGIMATDHLAHLDSMSTTIRLNTYLPALR